MNYVYFAIIVVCVGVSAFMLYKLLGIEKIKAWLVWAVSQAEKEFGSGTGKLKLAKVYDMFTDKFPFLQAIVPYSTFSNLVDIALDEMKEMLKNDKINAIIEGDENADG